MPSDSVIPAALVAAAAAVLLLTAYAVGVRGRVWLVAGYRPDRVRDPAGLARAVGGGLAVLGVACLAAALAALPGVSARAVAVGLAVALAVAGGVLLAREARRHLAGERRVGVGERP